MGNKPANLIKHTKARRKDLGLDISQDYLPLYYCCQSVRGCRNEQEDSHITDELMEFKGKPTNVAFFAIFDGHSGDSTAKYLGDRFETDFLLNENNEHPELDPYYLPDPSTDKNEPYRSFADLTTNSTAEELGDYLTNERRIVEKFAQCEEETINNPTLCTSGAAAVTTFLKFKKNSQEYELICANVGDSRAVFCDAGKVIPISNDHKPSAASEISRIKDAGHYVVSDRVDGQLALARSFGDKKYKSSSTQTDMRKQAVIAVPEIIKIKTSLHEDVNPSNPYKFLIMGCDGLWDVYKNEQICEFVTNLLKKFDIFNPDVKVPANYTDPLIAEGLKKKGDDWVYIPIEDWTEMQYQQWEHTIPNPYPVFNNCKSVLTLAQIVLDQLESEKNMENSPQREKYKKVFDAVKELKENHDELQERLEKTPYLTTVEEKLAKITEILMDDTVVMKASTDNVSIIIVLLDNHEIVNKFPKEEPKSFPEAIIVEESEENKKNREKLKEVLSKTEALIKKLKDKFPEKTPEFDE